LDSAGIAHSGSTPRDAPAGVACYDRGEPGRVLRALPQVFLAHLRVAAAMAAEHGQRQNGGQQPVKIALAEAAAGVLERDNDNRGARVDEYQKSANGALGEAWCAKFVYWCYDQAARRLRVKNPLPPIFGAAQLELWGIREKKQVPTPAIGDICIARHRHAGLATGSATPSGIFPSVEGNTWAKSDYAHRREGVYALNKEKVDQCTFFRVV